MEFEIDFSKSKIEAKDSICEANKPSKVVDGVGESSPDRETAESVIDIVSPFTQFSSSSPLGFCAESGAICCEVSDVIDSSPQTPKEDIFNPFAPGSEDLLFAPLAKKRVKEVNLSVARRLDFGIDDDDEEENEKEVKGKEGLGLEGSSFQEEEVILETMYESLLDFIVANQAESVVATEIDDCEEDFETPTKLPLLTGIAKICPPAPRKAGQSGSNSRRINQGLCRKLEF